MSKVNLQTKLKDEKGNEMGTKISCLIPEGKSYKVAPSGSYLIALVPDKEFQLTLKDVICRALLHEDQKVPLTGAQKDERYRLWEVVNTATSTVDLKSQDITLIKEAIEITEEILIMGQCKAILEK